MRVKNLLILFETKEVPHNILIDYTHFLNRMNVSTVGYRISSVKLHLFCSKWDSLENNNKSVAGYIMNGEINLYANFICCNYSIPFVDVDLHIFFQCICKIRNADVVQPNRTTILYASSNIVYETGIFKRSNNYWKLFL